MSPGRSGPLRWSCSAPCGSWCRSDARGAGRRRRSPSRRRRAAGGRPCGKFPLFQVPFLLRLAPSERGKNSYQLPTPARGALDPQGEGQGEGHQARERLPRDLFCDARVCGGLEASGGGEALARHGLRGILQDFVVRCRGAGAGEEPRAHGEGELHVDAGRNLDLGRVKPGGPLIQPGLNAPTPVAWRVEQPVDLPAVAAFSDFAHPVHRLRAARVCQQHVDADDVVALLEDGRSERDDLSDTRLRRPEVLWLLRRQVANRNAPQPWFIRNSHSSTVVPAPYGVMDWAWNAALRTR